MEEGEGVGRKAQEKRERVGETLDKMLVSRPRLRVMRSLLTSDLSDKYFSSYS